jgi:hypothetical protein
MNLSDAQLVEALAERGIRFQDTKTRQEMEIVLTIFLRAERSLRSYYPSFVLHFPVWLHLSKNSLTRTPK